MTRPAASRTAGLLAASAALSVVLSAAPARAEAPAAPVRGIVAAFDGGTLTIRRPGGATVGVRVGPRARVLAATGARPRDIKPESYLGVVSGDGPEPRRAAAVTLYAPSERGFEAGRRPWDTAPGATLTGGWVADLTDAGGPTRVSLRYDGGQSAFTIPDGTPVTQIGPGERSLLVPGAAVTALTHAGPDGVPEAGVVAVGRLGAVPGL